VLKLQLQAAANVAQIVQFGPLQLLLLLLQDALAIEELDLLPRQVGIGIRAQRYLAGYALLLDFHILR
jgi:hypothetical protein